MLLLPRSCARSHFVLVLFLSTILGTFAIPLAPRESPSNIPERKSRRGDNKLEVTLQLQRRDSAGNTLPFLFEKNRKDPGHPDVVLLLPDDNWFILLTRVQELSAKKDPTTEHWKIHREPVTANRRGLSLGRAVFQHTKDKLYFYEAIDNLPPQPSPYGALHMLIEYMSGRMKMDEYPLPATFKYEDQENNWQQIFWAMTNPTRENQYPHTPYLKLAPGMTLNGWRKLNRPRKNGGISATWPFVGTVLEHVPHVQEEAVPSLPWNSFLLKNESQVKPNGNPVTSQSHAGEFLPWDSERWDASRVQPKNASRYAN